MWIQWYSEGGVNKIFIVFPVNVIYLRTCIVTQLLNYLTICRPPTSIRRRNSCKGTFVMNILSGWFSWMLSNGLLISAIRKNIFLKLPKLKFQNILRTASPSQHNISLIIIFSKKLKKCLLSTDWQGIVVKISKKVVLKNVKLERCHGTKCEQISMQSHYTKQIKGRLWLRDMKRIQWIWKRMLLLRIMSEQSLKYNLTL